MSNIIDADWVPVDDNGLICRSRELTAAYEQARRELTHEAYIYSSGAQCHTLARGALLGRCKPARDYLERNQRKRHIKTREWWARVRRVAALVGLGAGWAGMLFFLWG